MLPNSPDEPLRLLEPLPPTLPELALHDHNGQWSQAIYRRCLGSLCLQTGHVSVVIVRPLV